MNRRALSMAAVIAAVAVAGGNQPIAAAPASSTPGKPRRRPSDQSPRGILVYPNTAKPSRPRCPRCGGRTKHIKALTVDGKKRKALACPKCRKAGIELTPAVAA